MVNPLENQPESFSDNGRRTEKLPENHWLRIMEDLYEKSGEIPGPLQVRARAMLDALGIPAGEVSALETNAEGKRTNPERDRIIAEYLTNHPGVWIDKEKGIISHDFRDIYPDGLPEELTEALNPRTRAIMEVEYEHQEWARKKFGDTEDMFEADTSIQYHRLSGGVDLFLRGYVHRSKWQNRHGPFLKRANQHASVLCIEGFPEEVFGKSVPLL